MGHRRRLDGMMMYCVAVAYVLQQCSEVRLGGGLGRFKMQGKHDTSVGPIQDVMDFNYNNKSVAKKMKQ